MSRVEGLDLYVVKVVLFIEGERVKICDMCIVEGVVDVSGLAGGLFGSFVAESAGVVAMCV